MSQDVQLGSVVEIYDVTGKMVKNHNLEAGYDISISDLRTGLFFVRIISPDGGVLMRKLQKQ